MRIVIDMQGAQSTGSRNRGIGRYILSLSLAIERNKGEHEIFLALNGNFPASIESIRSTFHGIVPHQNIKVWDGLSPMAHEDSANDWRRQSGEVLREEFLASLNPDVVLVGSLFEGYVDDTVTSITSTSSNFITAVIHYDLIPYIYRDKYLTNTNVEAWYLEKVEHLRRSDLFLSISGFSQQEAIDMLGLAQESVINISTDADSCFEKINIPSDFEEKLLEKYGIERSFVMYTGGIDHRKNIEGLIRAYAQLPIHLRNAHQLVIVCSIDENDKDQLKKLASEHGLAKCQLILTGFVTNEDLIALYNLCALFVFPSFHEGFGLPVLEAMRCGAPVIASNVSSLPEVVGLSDALFDPYSDQAIAQAIERALSDNVFRARLIEHCNIQKNQFSWDKSAQHAIIAMEKAVADQNGKYLLSHHGSRRPKLAYVSPFPPERSGIADYSAELLPVLAKYYDIDVVTELEVITDNWIMENCCIRSVDWFAANASDYERVLYHFGNSSFHQHMFSLLKKIPGVVVLHDFYLSGVLHHMDASGYAPKIFNESLMHSHGYEAVYYRQQSKDVADVIWKYPSSRAVIENSKGVIVHSANSIRLAQQWYKKENNNWSVIPLLRNSENKLDKNLARKQLGFSEDDIIVCSFGMIAPTKLNHRLLNAWLNSDLAKENNCHLVFVGENHPGDYGSDLLKSVEQKRANGEIRISGWVDEKVYKQYLAAADIGVQLRTLSRGETSAAVLDCMNFGLATIVNANGSMGDLDDHAVWKLADDFADEDLIKALEVLLQDGVRRTSMGEVAKNIIIEKHNPAVCAEQYNASIEHFYSIKSAAGVAPVISSIAAIKNHIPTEKELIALAGVIGRNFDTTDRVQQLFVDVSSLVEKDVNSKIKIKIKLNSLLRELLLNPPVGLSIEPVYATIKEPYRYARKFTSQFLNIPQIGLDECIDFASGDKFFGLNLDFERIAAKANYYQYLRAHGVEVKFMVWDSINNNQKKHLSNCLNIIGETDGVVCISKDISDEMGIWMNTKIWNRLLPFSIDWIESAVHGSSDIKNMANILINN